MPESVTLLYQGWYIVHSQGLSAGAKGFFPLISSNCRLTGICFDPGYSVTVRDATTSQSCALQSQETFNAVAWKLKCLIVFSFLSPGEFGSVMEGLLTQEESVLKVAVKTMKSE